MGDEGDITKFSPPKVPLHVVEHRLRTVEALMLSGLATSQVCEQAKKHLSITAAKTTELMRKIRARWLSEDSESRASWKSAQIRRLMGYIKVARGGVVQSPSGEQTSIPPNFGALAKFEGLLADLQGTRDPIKLDFDVTVSQAIVHVAANMTPAQIALFEKKYEKFNEFRASRTKEKIFGPKPVLDKDKIIEAIATPIEPDK